MPARWEDVLDVQMDLHRFMTSETGREYGSRWFGSVYEANADTLPGSEHQWRSLDDAVRNGADFAQFLGVQAFNAEPIWVEPDMMTLIEHAAESFKPEPLHETDLITTDGLLVLPRALWMAGGPNKLGIRRQSWRIAQWSVRPAERPPYPGAQTLGRRVLLTLWHDNEYPDDIDEEQERLALGTREKWNLDKVTRYLPNHVTNWPFGENHPGQVLTDEGALRVGEDVQLQMQAMWRLLSQTISVNVKARPPRQVWKRAQRARLPHEHVTVVRLRRPASPPKEGDPEVVNWTHRWVVGAHWRWQWYRDDAKTTPCGHIEPGELPCNATGGVHRQIWIAPFTKGPEHLPLVVNKARVFVFER